MHRNASRAAPAQTALPGFDAEPEPTDSLFFAVMPDAGAQKRLTALAQQLQASHGLGGKVLAGERFHISLFSLGEYHGGLPADTVARARDAAARVGLPAFSLEFDRIWSFGKGGRALVLRGGAGMAGLAALHAALGRAMTEVGLGRHAQTSFTPHLTLLYGETAVAEQGITPLGWNAGEFVLIHSLLGQTRYIPLGCWLLQV